MTKMNSTQAKQKTKLGDVHHTTLHD